MTVEEQVTQIIARLAVLDPATIAPDTPIADLGLDSLALAEAIFAIEEIFDITVPFNANVPAAGDFDLTSVATVAAGIERLTAERR